MTASAPRKASPHQHSALGAVHAVCERNRQDLGTYSTDVVEWLEEMEGAFEEDDLLDLVGGDIKTHSGDVKPAIEIVETTLRDIVRTIAGDERADAIAAHTGDLFIRCVFPSEPIALVAGVPDGASPQLATLSFQGRRTFLGALADSCAIHSDYSAIEWEVTEGMYCCVEHEEPERVRGLLETCCVDGPDGEAPLLSIREVPCDCGTCDNTVRLYTPSATFRLILGTHETPRNREARRARKRTRRVRRRR